MPNKSGVAEQILSLPKGGGAIKGLGEKFQPDLHTGTGNFSIPIRVSPGRNGFQPELSLNYSTGSGNGPYGIGWSLGVPNVSRRISKGIPLYQDQFDARGNPIWHVGEDVFVLSGAEDLVHIEDGHYRPRTEGLFARIQRLNAPDGGTCWIVTTKDGLRSVYGQSEESRLFVVEQGVAKIFQWLLNETQDTYGNKIVYRYKKDDGGDLQSQISSHPEERNHNYNQVYLKSIFYVNYKEPLAAEEKYLWKIEFDYGEHDEAGGEVQGWDARPDPFSQYRSGFEIRIARRCQRILVKRRLNGEADQYELIRSYTLNYQQDPYSGISLLSQITLHGHRNGDTGSFPPLSFDYTNFEPTQRQYETFSATCTYLPEKSLADPNYELIDMEGNGLPGIIHTTPTGYRYWTNMGNMQMAVPRPLKHLPAGVTIADDGVQFADMQGNGSADLLVTTGTIRGYYANDFSGEWQQFHHCHQALSFNLKDPNVKLVDLDGDGMVDILTTLPHHLLYIRNTSSGDSLNFATPEAIERVHDLNEFPDVYFGAPEQRVRLADMSGDGLQDIVLIHHRLIIYWPNLGHGNFGKQISMWDAPSLPHRYDPKRLFFSDVNGDGLADLIYVDFNKVHLWINQSGNRWSDEIVIHGSPAINDIDSVRVADMKGTGTQGILWTYDYAQQKGKNFKYLDFTGGSKPLLLCSIDNNVGARTIVSYRPSTDYFIADRARGKPWNTHLSFPVHVVDTVEIYDFISRNRFITRYAYHHGYYDGVEREFRGFGMVENWDTTEYGFLCNIHSLGDTNIDESSYVPPMHTKTWFHTGAFDDGSNISHQMATEYFRAPQKCDFDSDNYEIAWNEFEATLLPDNLLPAGLDVSEIREACRALKGSILRREIYADDNSPDAKNPYSVSETNYTIELLQSRGVNQHAVFYVHSRETLEYQYERNPDDPRINHRLILEVDQFGNVIKEAAIGYGRQFSDPNLMPIEQTKQTQVLMIYTENNFTNDIDSPEIYRAPQQCETHTYEISGPQLVSGMKRRAFQEVLGDTQIAHPIAYHIIPDTAQTQARLIEHIRTYYRRDDLTGDMPLPLGMIEPLALPYETYRLAFTPELLIQIFEGCVTEAMLREGGYVNIAGDLNWWIPSGRIFYSNDKNHSPAEELASAIDHFFLPLRLEDPFRKSTTVTYDEFSLFPIETHDSLQNVVRAEYDYRAFQPKIITDVNHSVSEVHFDALGMVIATAIYKGQEGDSFDDFLDNLSADQIEDFLTDPLTLAAEALGTATTRIIYDLDRFQKSRHNNPHQPENWLPVYAAMLMRETHESNLNKHPNDPRQDEKSKVQVNFSYSDGFGREIQKKIQAEPGDVDGDYADPRWVGSGWTIFNNKGKPVRQYEPFFSKTHHSEFAKEVGVSPVLFYDPLDRVVATLHPNQTYEKVVFDPWQQRTYDVNDTVLFDPSADEDVKGFFLDIQGDGEPPRERIPKDEYSPTWYQERINGGKGDQEKRAAEKAAVHTDTPTEVHFDTLGRPFLTIADNGNNQKYHTQVLLDIEGNQRAVIDARDRIVMRYDYDMLGNRIHQTSVDAGDRWMLNDVTGKPIRRWDSRGHSIRHTYDELRRPTGLYVQSGNEPQEQLAEYMVYGEKHPQAESLGLRGKVFKVLDGAGVVTNERYDFKGNLTHNKRQIASEFKQRPDWRGVETHFEIAENVTLDIPAIDAALTPFLGPDGYSTVTIYDALNRATSVTTPDGSVYRPTFNEANLLDRVDVNLQGAAVPTPFVKNINYNAKGQRELIRYGNDVTTTYEYDLATFQLIHLQTLHGVKRLQDLSYIYDPVGNITYIRDDAQPPIFFDNHLVDPHAEYTYDALYRLIEATGREHLGQNGAGKLLPPVPHSYDDKPRTGKPHPSDGQAMGRYTEEYRYDAVGNIMTMHHRVNGDMWTQSYQYALDSNRLLATSLPTDPGNLPDYVAVPGYSAKYTYDAHGNMTSMPHLPIMEWDFEDQLQMTQQQVVNNGDGERTYYTYDAAGQRVRKVTVSQNGNLKDERIYLGRFEIYRKHSNANAGLVRESLHIMDDKQHIALVETRNGINDGTAKHLIRYQFGNHLGSAILELDDTAQIISYEEYYPYGSTSYQAVNKDIKAVAKRYRYTGKERDKESGLYYHGARYYAPWLGRWTSCDPKDVITQPRNARREEETLDSGSRDKTLKPNSLYEYVLSNPVRFWDPNGKKPKSEPSIILYTTIGLDTKLPLVKDTSKGKKVPHKILEVNWTKKGAEGAEALKKALADAAISANKPEAAKMILEAEFMKAPPTAKKFLAILSRIGPRLSAIFAHGSDFEHIIVGKETVAKAEISKVIGADHLRHVFLGSCWGERASNPGKRTYAYQKLKMSPVVDEKKSPRLSVEWEWFDPEYRPGPQRDLRHRVAHPPPEYNR